MRANMDSRNIKEIIFKIFAENNINIDNINEDDSLIAKGILDSMTFVNILLAIEEELNIEIDFENIDINSIVTINSLCDAVSKITN